MIQKIYKIEFVFNQPSEFEDPNYCMKLDSITYGYISYVDGHWFGSLEFIGYKYGSEVFKVMAKKIDELNESLEEQRSKFFGF